MSDMGLVKKINGDMERICYEYRSLISDDVAKLANNLNFLSLPKRLWPTLKALGPLGLASMSYHYGGMQLYPPSVKMLNVYTRNLKMYAEYDYLSTGELARRYDLSRKQVGIVIKEIEDRMEDGGYKLCKELEELLP